MAWLLLVGAERSVVDEGVVVLGEIGRVGAVRGVAHVLGPRRRHEEHGD